VSRNKNQQLALSHDRRITVEAADDGQETIEIRGAGDAVELRIRMTSEGPRVELTGASVEIRASESIHMQCKEFEVEASERLQLGSGGDLEVKVEGETHLYSAEETFIRGKKIWLN